jgi:FKBP-type peptidyl-prolyl cis-trans isomerase (trigger factor)
MKTLEQTHEEIKQRMDELAREYHDTHDPEIPEEIFELARRLRELDHGRQIKISPMFIAA